MTEQISINNALKLMAEMPMVDVRTPDEFAGGHIPGAHNIPLFSNEERAEVGTAYKKYGREAAVLLGFDLTGPKWSGYIKRALELAPQKKLIVHCWRGGMRSGAMAWALSFYGFDVYVLEGGYKAYRKWVHNLFSATYNLCILGGMTGAGKTKVLQELQAMGEQVVDLEALARHQGSTYGSMNHLVQPSQEKFENDLASCLSLMDSSRLVWVEDESFTIGRCAIPHPFWDQMQQARLLEMDISKLQRVEALVQEYGILDKNFLEESTFRIRKRLGFENAQKAIDAIRQGRMAAFIEIVLAYYDKTYTNGLSKRPFNNVHKLSVTVTDPKIKAQRVLDYFKTNILVQK